MSQGDDKTADANNRLRERAVGWIGSADSKAAAIATLVALMGGFMGLQQAEEASKGPAFIVYCAFLALSALTVLLCLAVFWPRVNRRKHLGSSAIERSPTFFGEVQGTYDQFKKRAVSQEVLDADELEQTYVLAKIAQQKMTCVKATILSFGTTVAVLAALSFMTLRDSGEHHATESGKGPSPSSAPGGDGAFKRRTSAGEIREAP